MANHNIKDPPEFNSELRMLETTDRAHADVFNEIFNVLINNDNYLRQSAAGVLQIDIVIPVDGWAADSDTNGACALFVDVAVENVTEDMIPFLAILPESQKAAKACGLCTTVRTVEGALRIYANQTPETEIAGSLVLICANGFAGGGGSASYTLPVASATTLGGVMIGDGVSVSENGTISIDDAAVIEEISATDEEVAEMLDKVFGTTETENSGN